MKLKRFMCEYADYIERNYLNGYNADIEQMLTAYTRGTITIREVMNTLVQIEYASYEQNGVKEQTK